MMLLQNKNAIMYGAGGSVGEAIAKAFAEAGAKVFITGRHLAKVQKIADEIIASGGSAEAAEVDATDEHAVNGHMEQVLKKAGTIDICFKTYINGAGLF